MHQTLDGFVIIRYRGEEYTINGEEFGVEETGGGSALYKAFPDDPDVENGITVIREADGALYAEEGGDYDVVADRLTMPAAADEDDEFA